jgi:hypothetical protein
MDSTTGMMPGCRWRSMAAKRVSMGMAVGTAAMRSWPRSAPAGGAQFLAQAFLGPQHGQGVALLALGREARRRAAPAHDDRAELLLQRAAH